MVDLSKYTVTIEQNDALNERNPNTQECAYFGRKLSNTSCDNIQVSLGYVVIGSEKDDEIHFGECLEDGEAMLEERVKITLLYEPDEGDGFVSQIDLEDVLRFAAQNCSGIYKRIYEEYK